MTTQKWGPLCVVTRRKTGEKWYKGRIPQSGHALIPDVVLQHFQAALALESGVGFMLLPLHLPVALHAPVVELSDQQDVFGVHDLDWSDCAWRRRWGNHFHRFARAVLQQTQYWREICNCLLDILQSHAAAERLHELNPSTHLNRLLKFKHSQISHLNIGNWHARLAMSWAC